MFFLTEIEYLAVNIMLDETWFNSVDIWNMLGYIVNRFKLISESLSPAFKVKFKFTV